MVNGEPFSGRQFITASFSAPNINKAYSNSKEIDHNTTIELIFENTIFIELRTHSCFIYSHIGHHCVILYIVRGKTNLKSFVLSDCKCWDTLGIKRLG